MLTGTYRFIKGNEVLITGAVRNDQPVKKRIRVYVVTHEKDIEHEPNTWKTLEPGESWFYSLTSDFDYWNARTLENGWWLETRDVVSGDVFDRWVPDILIYRRLVQESVEESVVEKAKEVYEKAKEKVEEVTEKQKKFIKCTLPLLSELPGLPWPTDLPAPPGFEKTYLP